MRWFTPPTRFRCHCDCAYNHPDFPDCCETGEILNRLGRPICSGCAGLMDTRLAPSLEQVKLDLVRISQ